MAGGVEENHHQMKGASPGMKSTETLHQTKKMPMGPMRMATIGFAFVLTLGYFTLYTKKKPEASALDVAKVVTGTSKPNSTHPNN